jgi:excisionase family DNA binding protein
MIWTTQQLADAAGLSARRIRQLIEEGSITAYKPGREYYITGTEAQRFLQERRKEGSTGDDADNLASKSVDATDND